ncbi:hypothetical protein Cal7507_2116 [Calothrix sp. PCC 7507]|nr:hypothetical protein Cal7507_2116 [Calothrix sp. PCC 7507]
MLRLRLGQGFQHRLGLLIPRGWQNILNMLGELSTAFKPTSFKIVSGQEKSLHTIDDFRFFEFN